MSDLSPGRFTPADDQKSKGRKKPGLRIDFDADADPLAGIGEEASEAPAEPADEAAPTPAKARGRTVPAAEPATEAREDAPGAPWPEAAPPPAEARVRRPARPGPDTEDAARLLGVPAPLARIEVTVAVEVGRRRMTLAELVSAEPGALIALDRLTDEPVDILVNGKPFGRGEIVALGENFGVRLLDLADGKD